MKKLTSTLAIAAASGFLVAAPAMAEMTATATTDLNIRSGPGPTYPAVGAIKGGDSAAIMGCIEGSKWCQVAYNGKTGWSYSDYLAMNASGQAYVVTERRPELPTVTYETTGSTAAQTATTGAVGGAIAGALIAGPVGAAVGGAAGASIGAAVSPPQQVRTYVTDNRADPVYLEGEVVVGAGVPDTVQLRPVPDYEYSYAYVNGQPVLVDPGSRHIVYVYR